MRKYDLHIHSKFSDGDYTLQEIVDKLKENGIEIFSITDHDNADSIKAMEGIDKKGLTYIPGVEFSANKDGYNMHILGYNVDGNDEKLLGTCRKIKTKKDIKLLEIIKQLKDQFDIEITKEETMDLLNSKTLVGQTTIARILVNKGICKTIKEAFSNYMKKLDLKTVCTIDLEEAVRVIHEAGGVAVLAHPISIEKSYGVDIEDVFHIFRNVGLDGIEIFNSRHTFTDIRRYYKLAKRENLLISGGSDYHGEIMKPNVKLGRVSKDETEKREHYEMTIISRCINRENEFNKKEIEEEFADGESR